MAEARNITINISTLTIVKVIAVIVGLAFLYAIRDVIGVLVVAFVLASALTPFVDWLNKRLSIPRIFGIVIVYVVLLGIISVILALLIPAIVNQVSDIANNFPQYYNKIQTEFGSIKNFSITQSFVDKLQSSLQSLNISVGQATGGVFTAISSIFGGIFTFIGIVVITFYLILQEQTTRNFLKSIVPIKYLPTVTPIFDAIQVKMGGWLRGQLALSAIIFLADWIGLTILGVHNALILALFAGLMEIVPFIGSTIAAIPAVFFGFTQSSWQGFAVIILFILVQQFENNIIVPKVMQKAVGLNPLIVIVAMLVAAKIAGIAGLLLAVPAVLIIETIIKRLYKFKEEETDRNKSIAEDLPTP